MSSIILSNSEFSVGKNSKKEMITGNVVISMPARKNEFVKRKESAMKLIEDEQYMKLVYDSAKEILYKAADRNTEITGKTKMSLFKNRTFDKDYLKPEIEKYLSSELSSGS